MTNLLLHGIDVPSNVRHDNTLARPLPGITSIHIRPARKATIRANRSASRSSNPRKPGGARKKTASRRGWKTGRRGASRSVRLRPGNFNLDLKNPHNPDTGPGDVDHLLPEYEKLLAQITETRTKLKQELHHALTATAGDC